MKSTKNIAVIVSIFAISATCFAQETNRPKASAAATPVATDTAVKLPLLLDLGATKCMACKQLAPILDELSKEYAGQFNVEFIDVWQKENAAKAEQHKIETIPTQIFFAADGRELFRHVGFISKDNILAKWKELGFTFTAPAK